MNRLVHGHCPACGYAYLGITPGGVLLCFLGDCPRPTAASELLAAPDLDHVVQLHADDFTLRHPLAERLDDALLDCTLHAVIADSDGPPAPPGRYRVTNDSDGRISYDPLPTAGA